MTWARSGDALTVSANDGADRIMSLLLDAGADINAPDDWALQQAALQGHLHIVQLLLSHGADGNKFSELHMPCTALQASCNSGHVDITNLLL